MLAFDWTTKLGTIALAPWVALIGFDLGVVGGIAAAAVALALWLVATDVSNNAWDTIQLVVRSVALLVIGVGSALAGRRMRVQQDALRSTTALQASLIDATLDGICLTDANGEVLISNKPLRKLALEFGMPLSGTVPERLLAIADKMAEPERYRERMRALANEVGDATIDEFEVAGTGRVFRGYTTRV